MSGRKSRWPAILGTLGVCALALGAATCERAPRAPRVLIVGIDGADWRLVRPLMSAGQLPNLQRIMESGVHGPLWSLKPTLSPVIWTTIATGKGPDKHGVLDFVVPDPNTGQMVVVTSQLRQSKAFWNILSDQGLRVCVVGWWATWPAEPINGVMVSDRLSYHAFIKSPEAGAELVYPTEKLSELLALRGEAADVPYETAREFLEVTPEEYRAAPALDFHDPISHFRHIYSTMAGHAAIAARLIRTEQPDVIAVYFEGVDTAGHMYMRYTPPPYPGTTDEERRKFGHAVESFYRYQDRLIGDLLTLTDENTTVIIVSDHGFLAGRERPIDDRDRFDYATAARWHRLEGVIAMRGPMVKSAGLAAGAASPFNRATVFDVTPTLLTLLGIPAGADMDGRVLGEMLADGVSVPARLASYEDESWRETRAQARTSVQAVDEEMKERLRSLGYIGASDSEVDLSLWGQWSLAEYYVFRNQPEKARRELEDLRQRAPDWPNSYFLLGMIHTQHGEYEQARKMFEQVLALKPEELEARLNLAFVLRQLGAPEKGAVLLEEVARAQPSRLDVRINLAILYRELGRLDRAAAELEGVLRADPESHPAHAQMAMLCEARGDGAGAAEHWQTALRLNPQDQVAREHLNALRRR